MVVITKSKSHPDLLFYGRSGVLRSDDCGDSVSSLEDAVPSGKQQGVKISENSTAKNVLTARSVIGGYLWKLLLNGDLPVSADTIDWSSLQEQHEETLGECSVEDLQRFHSALTSIVILDESIDERATALLKEYNGHLINVSATITQELKQQSPETFTAFVADFNDNLAYSMKQTRGIPTRPAQNSNITQDEWNRALFQLEHDLQTTLQSPQPLELQASFLKTEFQTIPQPAHVDYPWKVLRERAPQLWLAFFSLTHQGMILQLWPRVKDSPTTTITSEGCVCPGQLVFVPLGKLFMVPSDTIHGGGFRTKHSNTTSTTTPEEETGNLRYHLYLATNGSALPPFAQNVYTLPHDKRHELAEVCHNAPHLEGEVESHMDNNNKDDALLMELLLD